MPKIHTDDDAVWKVWNWCIDAFGRCGQTLKFPDNTNPIKTYQWRYTARLVRKLEEWEFDDQASVIFIRYAVEYARDKRLLRKGLSAFFQNNILDICYDRIDSECEEIDKRLALLRKNHSFLLAHTDGKLFINVLLSRSAPDTYYNIVEWFERHRISTIYMALSRSCTVALSRLSKTSPEQRSLLPKSSELFCIMNELTNNVAFRRQALLILGNDWREL